MKLTSPAGLGLAAVLFTMFISCRPAEEPITMSRGILTPLSQAPDKTNADDNGGHLAEQALLPLVNPGKNYSILTLLDDNLDLGELSDEQVIVAMPLEDTEAPLSLMIASTNPIRNKYQIVWTTDLGARTLTGITLRSDDLTGNGRNDIIVAGFDEKGRHVTEIFAVEKTGKITDFHRVFGMAVDGNIDIKTQERSPGYWNGVNSGEPYTIIVQQRDLNSNNAMDIIETEWAWNHSAFNYSKENSRSIKAESILEERIGKIYTGGVEVYEDYLKGAWYRESGNGSFEYILFFDPETREITFYDGAVQEIFSWENSRRTTGKNLIISRVNNIVIPAIFESIKIVAESWDRIVMIRSTEAWNGSYRRIGPALQSVLDTESSLKPILKPLSLTGVWKSPDGSEIIFDSPRVDWKEDGNVRSGTASLFTIGGTTVLQVQFMKNNGAIIETINWIAEYSEDADDTRIIRYLTLTPAVLNVNSIRSADENWMRYEQIEVVSAAN